MGWHDCVTYIVKLITHFHELFYNSTVMLSLLLNSVLPILLRICINSNSNKFGKYLGALYPKVLITSSFNHRVIPGNYKISFYPKTYHYTIVQTFQLTTVSTLATKQQKNSVSIYWIAWNLRVPLQQVSLLTYHLRLRGSYKTRTIFWPFYYNIVKK